jgi:hypothetical protein
MTLQKYHPLKKRSLPCKVCYAPKKHRYWELWA